jgi:RNA polymerase sigma-70 factor (sigma-E family)
MRAVDVHGRLVVGLRRRSGSIRRLDGERLIWCEENQMVRGARSADEAAFEEFVRARTAALARTAYLLTGDHHHAQDLVQTALARAAVRWARLDDPESYVRRVLYTQGVSWWRVLRRRRGEVLVGAPPDVRPDRGADPDVRVVLAQALAKLTPKQRTILIVRFYEDRTEGETAALLSIALGTVKTQTRHALSRLRLLCPELAFLLTERSTEEARP